MPERTRLVNQILFTVALALALPAGAEATPFLMTQVGSRMFGTADPACNFTNSGPLPPVGTASCARDFVTVEGAESRVRHFASAVTNWFSIGTFASIEWTNVGEFTEAVPRINEVFAIGRSRFESEMPKSSSPYYEMVVGLSISGYLRAEGSFPSLFQASVGGLVLFGPAGSGVGSCNAGGHISKVGPDGRFEGGCLARGRLPLSPDVRTPLFIETTGGSSVGQLISVGGGLTPFQSATSDFLHTTAITSVQIFDPAGNPVDVGALGLVDQFGNRLTSGGIVGPTPVSAPEPATFILFALGVSALVATRSRNVL